ncbi:MAG: hypothetical protein IPH44_38030 [Myxococcales bacterium]|nr:hypothetical protein [Myxococcales bacterium]
MMRSSWPALAVVIAACSFNPQGEIDGGAGDPDAAAGDPDAASPIDAPLAIDAPATIDGPPCTPSCNGDLLMTCGGGAPETCPAGCGTTGGAHCLVFQPSNGVPTTAAIASTVDLAIASGRLVVFNTDDGSITSYDHANADPMVIRGAGTGVVAQIDFTPRSQTGAPELGVWSLRTLTLPDANAWVGFRGARVAAVIAAGPITVRGWIDVSGGQDLAGATCTSCPGAGGGPGGTLAAAASGCAPGGAGNYSGTAWETGGAGGGMATAGGSGGASGILGGAPASIATCSGAALVPLAGGGGGGRGATSGGSGGANGGGGGGGLQLTSLAAIVVDGADAEVFSGGVGGDGIAAAWGGGGGGAGGALLLEAPSVTLANGAAVTANGGGGGAGHLANDGEFGRSDTQRAAGGVGDGINNDNGRGGAGGVTAVTADVVGLPSNGRGGGDGTGGGGGAAGRVRLNTREGRTPMTTGAVLSPAASIGTRVAQ